MNTTTIRLFTGAALAAAVGLASTNAHAATNWNLFVNANQCNPSYTFNPLGGTWFQSPLQDLHVALYATTPVSSSYSPSYVNLLCPAPEQFASTSSGSVNFDQSTATTINVDVDNGSGVSHPAQAMLCFNDRFATVLGCGSFGFASGNGNQGISIPLPTSSDQPDVYFYTFVHLMAQFGTMPQALRGIEYEGTTN